VRPQGLHAHSALARPLTRETAGPASPRARRSSLSTYAIYSAQLIASAGQPSIASWISLSLPPVAFFTVANIVIAHLEHTGADLHARSTAGAEIPVNNRLFHHVPPLTVVWQSATVAVAVGGGSAEKPRFLPLAADKLFRLSCLRVAP